MDSMVAQRLSDNGSAPARFGRSRQSRARGPRLPLMAIVRHIRRNVARRIAIGELAEIARLSVYALVRAFRREHAITPYELILAVKIRRGSRMLRAGTSIADTAFLVGFADQSHFTRHFKRLTGETPHRFLIASQRAWRTTGQSDYAGTAA